MSQYRGPEIVVKEVVTTNVVKYSRSTGWSILFYSLSAGIWAGLFLKYLAEGSLLSAALNFTVMAFQLINAVLMVRKGS